MVESFAGHHTEYTDPFLPHVPCGAQLSRSISSNTTFYCQNGTGKTITYRQAMGWLLAPCFHFHTRCGLIRKPNLMCERNTVGLRIQPNCQ